MSKIKGRKKTERTKKPRLLLLSESLPVRQMDGGNIRIHNYLCYLASRYRITFVGFTRNKEELKLLAPLRDRCEQVWAFYLPGWRIVWNCFWGLFTAVPLNVCAYRHRGLRQLLKRLRRRDYQLVYVYRLRLAHYVKGWTEKKVLDLTDCLSEYYRQRRNRSGWLKRLYWGAEYLKMRRYELAMAACFARCLVVTSLEKARLNRLHNVRALGNGVDLEYFAPESATARAGLVFVGTMSYAPNADAARYFLAEILPLVRRELPDIDFTVVGRKPARALRRQRLTGVRFTGEVKDIRPYLHRAQVFVNPLRMGVGLQNKLLQAMACGVPVVTTPFSARGLAATGGHHLLVGKDSEEFARQVVQVCKIAGLASRLSKSGRRFVEVSYDWQAQFDKLEGIIAGI